MKNEIEKLMRPRFEVIADYPKSPFKVGEVFTPAIPIAFKSYPHLFRELKWWEKRTEDEMPKYIRFKEGGVVKVKEFTDVVRFGKFKCEETTIELFIADATPATEAEYKGE